MPFSADEVDIAARYLNAAIGAVSPMHLSVSWGDRMLTLDKSCGFLGDPRFKNAFEEVKGAHQYDQYGGDHTIAWRLNTLCWAARCALRAGGDFVECGVFKGDMAWVVSQVVGIENIPRLWLYDSFEGFSPAWSSQADYPGNPGFLDYANAHYKVEGMYEYVVGRFVENANVRVIKGFLPESLEQGCPDRIGYLHIDLNSSRAEVAVLEQLFDKVVPGGVIVFDDYGWKLFYKQKEAEDAFMEERGYRVLELPTGQGLVVKR